MLHLQIRGSGQDCRDRVRREQKAGRVHEIQESLESSGLNGAWKGQHTHFMASLAQEDGIEEAAAGGNDTIRNREEMPPVILYGEQCGTVVSVLVLAQYST